MKFPTITRIHWVFFPIIFLMVSAVVVDTSFGQDRRERRRKLVEDLLRVLVESGQESRDAHDHGHHDHSHSQPKQVELILPQANVKPTPQMIELRRHVKRLEAEADHLITDIRSQGASVPQLRPLLADAIHIRAELSLFGRRCQKFPTIDPLRNEFLTLDHSWRQLNHRLRHVHPLSQQCIACLDRVHHHHQQVCNVFNIEPQIDRQRLGQLATEMHADIKHLNRDLYYEFASNPEMPAIVRQGQLLQNQIVQYAPLIKRGDYESVVAAYKECRKTWRDFSKKVSRFQCERVQHDVAHIEELGHKFQAELWLTPELDREYLGNMCSWVDTEMQQILLQITLADLLQCKNPGAVLAAAKSFQKRCGTFSDCISEEKTFDRIVPEYRLFEDSWTTMDEQCRQLEKQEIISRLDEIQTTITRFQPIFGSGPAISHDLMVRLTADWGQLVNQIHARVVKFDPKQYGGNLHRDLCNSCEKMSRKIRRLNQLVVTKSKNKYRAHLDECFKQWQIVKSHLNKCSVEHRRQVARSRSQVEPLIAKLQLAYADY